jgi:hypothetical protein
MIIRKALLMGLLATNLLAQALPVGPLRVANTGFPNLNCRFVSPSGAGPCSITVTDHVSNFTLPGAVGSARLQSRLFPKGLTGTQAEGRYGYLYRVDLTGTAGLTFLPSVMSLTLPDVASIDPQDYDGDGNFDDIFVATFGTAGSVVPFAANWTPAGLELLFSGLNAGSFVGGGTSSVFFGFTSWNPPGMTAATVTSTPSSTTSGIQAVVPRGSAFPGSGSSFVLETAVNQPPGVFALSSLSNAKRATSGDELLFRLMSASSGVYGQPFFLVIDAVPASAPPAMIPGLLESHFGPLFLVYDFGILPSTSWYNGSLVNGLWKTLDVPPGVSTSLMVQGVLFAPPYSAGSILLTDAHRFDIL